MQRGDLRYALAYVLGMSLLTLLVVAACQENPADVNIVVTDTTPAQPCDSVRCPPARVDTIIDSIPFPVHDTVLIYCRITDPNFGNPWCMCENGFQGPCP